MYPPATSSLLDSYFLLSSLISHSLNLCSSDSVKHKVSHPHKITSKVELCTFESLPYVGHTFRTQLG
jgi:hypothetical protein